MDNTEAVEKLVGMITEAYYFSDEPDVQKARKILAAIQADPSMYGVKPKPSCKLHDYYVLTDGTQVVVGNGWARFSDGTPSCKIRMEGDEIILLTSDDKIVSKDGLPFRTEPPKAEPTDGVPEKGMKIHSDVAWEIASNFSYCLASDTRTLAAMIDVQLATARNEALEEAADKILSVIAERKATLGPRNSGYNALMSAYEAVTALKDTQGVG